MAAAGGGAADAPAANALATAAQRTARNVGRVSRLPSAEGALLFGRFAARAGETPALQCCLGDRWSQRAVIHLRRLTINLESFAGVITAQFSFISHGTSQVVTGTMTVKPTKSSNSP